MSNRYRDRTIVVTREEQYHEILENRDVAWIEHYATGRIFYPSVEYIKGINHVRHMWKVGDRFYKLAHEHYGDSQYWWVIAWYNKTPTEGHVKLGDELKIPKPLSRVIEYVR